MPRNIAPGAGKETIDTENAVTGDWDALAKLRTAYVDIASYENSFANHHGHPLRGSKQKNQIISCVTFVVFEENEPQGKWFDARRL